MTLGRSDRPRGRGPIDLNDQRTWPAAFRRLVDQHLALPEEEWVEEVMCREAIAILRDQQKTLRAFHCTRLTEREIDDVRSDGLIPLDSHFTQQRIARAAADGYLTAEQAALFAANRDARDPNRRGRIFFFSERQSLKKPGQIGYLVECWGGEAINRAAARFSQEMNLVERIGRPTVVIAQLDVDLHCGSANPSILVAAIRGRQGRSPSLLLTSNAPVGAAHIESLEHPGSPFWERYVWTPRAGFKYL